MCFGLCVWGPWKLGNMAEATPTLSTAAHLVFKASPWYGQRGNILTLIKNELLSLLEVTFLSYDLVIILDSIFCNQETKKSITGQMPYFHSFLFSYISECKRLSFNLKCSSGSGILILLSTDYDAVIQPRGWDVLDSCDPNRLYPV